MAMTLHHPPFQANEAGAANTRDVSFSSYLDSAEREFIRNLSASIYTPSPGRDTVPTPRTSMMINRLPRHELGVFRAQRYFHENPNEQASILGKHGNVRREQKNRRAKREDLLENKSIASTTTTATTTTTTAIGSNSVKLPSQSVRSEGSWNSQFGMGLKLFSGLQCKGTCFNKKSVYTSNTQEMIKPSKSTYNNENRYRKSKISSQEHFAFPIIDTASYNHFEDKPKKSLEVFGFNHIGKQNIAQNLEKNLSILSWDAIPNTQNASFPFLYPATKKNSPKSVKSEEHEDARSDASSDLFEIENLSGVPHSQSSYAPSEASIEWSVVTASAAEFSGVYDHHSDHKNSDIKKIKAHQSTSPGGGLLFGCRNHKAVDVVGSFNKGNVAYRTKKMTRAMLLPYLQEGRHMHYHISKLPLSIETCRVSDIRSFMYKVIDHL